MAATTVSSDLSKLAQSVEVEKALVAAGIAVDNGLGLDGSDDQQRVTSNSDELVTIYSMQDGEPHEILRIDARRALTKRINGKPAFWIPEQGGEAPFRIGRGAIMCYLDPKFDESEQYDAIDRAWIDKVGLTGRTCNMMAPDKNNQRFVAQFDRDDHMAKKHPREWAIINARLTREREDKRNAATDQTNAAMVALAARVAGVDQTPAAAQAPEAPAAKPAAAGK